MGKTFTSKKKSTKKVERSKNQPLHDNFREYTTKELNRIKTEVCIKHRCPYLSRMQWTGKNLSRAATNSLVCNYIIIEQHSRGCMPDVCEYWKNKNVKKRKDVDNAHLFNKHVDFNDYI